MQLTTNPNSKSHVKAYGFENGYIRVEFQQGVTYDYGPNATEQDYNDLLQADSKGKYVQNVLKEKFKNPRKLQKHEAGNGNIGYVDISHEVTRANKINPDTPNGYCPSCGSEASGWEPPIEDQRYLDRIKQEREAHNLDSDESAHKLFLRNNGYIQECDSCGTTFFVDGRKAHIKVNQA